MDEMHLAKLMFQKRSLSQIFQTMLFYKIYIFLKYYYTYVFLIIIYVMMFTPWNRNALAQIEIYVSRPWTNIWSLVKCRDLKESIKSLGPTITPHRLFIHTTSTTLEKKDVMRLRSISGYASYIANLLL